MVMQRPDATRISVGIDLVQVSQVAQTLARLGDSYVNRIWTPDEIAHCRAQPAIAAARFATGFAAKAATLKALRLNDEGLDLRNINTRLSESGSWELELKGKAGELAQAAGWQSWSLSVSQEGDYATAVVAALSAS